MPIYNTHGELVANGKSDFWYPTHINLIDYDQYGLRESQYVWTGSNPNGTRNSPLGVGTGATQGYSTDATASHWIYDGYGEVNGDFYAISAPITVAPHRLPGDANFDGIVDFSDLLTVAQHYGQPGGWVDGDFDMDGAVGFDDLLILAQHYGQSQPAGTTHPVQSTPEPSGFIVCVLLVLLLALNKRIPHLPALAGVD